MEQKSGISHLLIYQKLTTQDFNLQLFGILRVSTLRFDGSPLQNLIFYSNLSCEPWCETVAREHLMVITYDSNISLSSLPVKVGCLTISQHIKSSTNDYHKGKNFGISKIVLNQCGPFDTITVDKTKKTETNCSYQS